MTCQAPADVMTFMMGVPGGPVHHGMLVSER